MCVCVCNLQCKSAIDATRTTIKPILFSSLFHYANQLTSLPMVNGRLQSSAHLCLIECVRLLIVNAHCICCVRKCSRSHSMIASTRINYCRVTCISSATLSYLAAPFQPTPASIFIPVTVNPLELSLACSWLFTWLFKLNLGE